MRRLLLVLAACGGGGSSPPDSSLPLPDCGLFFCTPPPPNGPVAVTVRRNQLPVAGVEVVFIDQLGNITTVPTDATGRAAAEVQIGASVTVVNPFGAVDGVDDLRTIVDAVPFDDLLVEGSVTDVVTMAVTAPADSGAASYELRTSCGNATLAAPSGQVTLPRCTDSANLLWLSLDAAGAPRGQITSIVALEEGGTIALAGAYTDVIEHRIEFTGLDPAVTEVEARATQLDPIGSIDDRAFTAAISSSIGNARVRLPRVPAAFTVIDSRPVPAGGALVQHGVLEWNPPESTDRLFIDLFDKQLPTVTSQPELVGSSITWSQIAFAHAALLESGPPPVENLPSFVTFELAVQRGDRQWRWSLASRFQGTVFQIPRLPTEHAIMSGDTVTIDRMQLANVPGGYDLIRHLLLSHPRLLDLIHRSLVPVSSGRILYQELR